MKKKDRCPKWSMAWNIQCELKKGHAGMCDNAGDGFMGTDPSKKPEVRETGIQALERKREAALRTFEERFEKKLRDTFPPGQGWGSMTEEARELEALSKMRREYMQDAAHAVSAGENSSMELVELALFESWVKARQ